VSVLQEADSAFFLLVRKPEPSHELGIMLSVDSGAGQRGALPEVFGAAALQDVARVVEMHDRFQALEVAVCS